MVAAEIPHNETQRLRLLKDLAILDTPPDQEFDAIAQLIASICDAPITAISFIDTNRQWFKSAIGTNLKETPRSSALCSHTILEHQTPLIIPDTTKDIRFSDNPLVTGEPHIRFYAGYPLEIAPGHTIGSLCVIDTKPRENFTEKEKLALKTLAQIVITLCRQYKFMHEMQYERIQSSQTFQKLVIDANPDLLFVKDAEFKIIEANPAFLELYPKHMQDKIIGYTTIEEYDGYEAESFLEMDRKAFKEGYSSTMETITCPDGRIRTLHTQKILFHDKMNQPYILCISRDVTEQDNLIQTLVKSNDELEKFAYVASHDLQEPIRMICNFSKILEDEYNEKLDDTAKQYLQITHSSATHMQHLVNDLLEYARTGNGSQETETTHCEKLLNYVTDNLNNRITETDATITHSALPTLVLNPTQIACVLQNLIENALKYQPKGHKPLIHISAKELPHHWEFSIKDNGIGMKEEYCEKIFEPFKRLHGKSEYPGTGIGLAICKKIIESNKGKIWATSAEGEGSSFYFTLPKESKPLTTA